MTRINRFIFHSDFATLKNDDKNTLTLVLPNNISIAGAGGSYTQSVSLAIGKPISQVRSLISTSRNGKFYPAPAINIAFDYGSSLPGVTGVAYISRVGNQIRLNMHILNPYNEPITLNGVGQTITARVSTYLNPF